MVAHVGVDEDWEGGRGTGEARCTIWLLHVRLAQCGLGGRHAGYVRDRRAGGHVNGPPIEIDLSATARVDSRGFEEYELCRPRRHGRRHGHRRHLR